MSKQFSVTAETVAVGDYEFAGEQAAKAERNAIVRVFRFRDIRGNVLSLPKYIRSAISDAGYEPVYLGGTTYSHSVIGLREKTN